MHSLRTNLQVQMWYGNTPDPLKSGWEENAGNLQPVGSDRPAVPQRLMKIIFCDCKGGCREKSACTCRKSGHRCTPSCGHCVVMTCTNVDPTFVDEAEDIE